MVNIIFPSLIFILPGSFPAFHIVWDLQHSDGGTSNFRKTLRLWMWCWLSSLASEDICFFSDHWIVALNPSIEFINLLIIINRLSDFFLLE